MFLFNRKLFRVYAAVELIRVNRQFLSVRFLPLQPKAQPRFELARVTRRGELPILFRIRKHHVIAVAAPAQRQVLDRFPLTVNVDGLLHDLEATIPGVKTQRLIRPVYQPHLQSAIFPGGENFFKAALHRK